MVHLSALAFVFLLAVPLVSAQEVLQGLYSPDGIVRDAAIAGDTLYVGGTFGFVGGSTGTVAVLDKETGAPDLTQPRFGGVVWDMISDGTGGHYVGGAFSSVDGQPRWNLAHVRADGTLNPDFRPDPFGQINPDYFGSVEALFLHEGVLYVGGRFDVVAGQPRRNLAALDAATGTLLPLSVTMTTENQGGADPRGFVETVAARAGVLYVGGLFNEVNGTIREGAFALRLSTGEILPWNPMLNQEADLESGEATALGFGETTVYVFGIFDTVRGAPRGGSAEVSLADPVTGEGGIPTAWNPGLSGGGPDIVITDEYIWSASFFPPALRRISRTTGQSQPVNSLGNPYNYGSDVTYDPEGGVSGQGTLYVAASRLDINAPRGRYNVIVGVDPATMQRTGYEVLAGVGTLGNDRIRSLAVTPGPDGRVIAGGEPVTYGGAPRRFLAGLDLTTGQVTGFGEEYIVFSSVDETTTSPDERFLYFLTFNGIGVGDLTTGELYAFPGGAALTAHHEARFESDTLAVRRAGPVVARRDGTPAPAFRAPPSESLRGSGNDRAVRGGTGALVASAERLYAHPEGGVVAFDRATGATLWTTPFPETVAAPDVPKLLLIEGGPPGAAGDTLFASGMIREVGGDPARTRFVALDAETGAVLDFATGTGPITSGTYGSGLAAVPGDGHIFLGGSGFTQAGGFPASGHLRCRPHDGRRWPVEPEPVRGAGKRQGACGAGRAGRPRGRRLRRCGP